MTTRRKTVPPAVRAAVLMEAGYKCASPTCRNVIALDIHHILWVKDGGPTEPDNLIALCGYCHDLHIQGHIPAAEIVAWEGLLVSLNNPNWAGVDVLLLLYDEERRGAAEEEWKAANPGDGRTGASPFRFTGDGLANLAPLITSGLAEISRRFSGLSAWGGDMPSFEIRLTDRGRALVEAWRSGDPAEIKRLLSAPR
jgi:hypothetical protein